MVNPYAGCAQVILVKVNAAFHQLCLQILAKRGDLWDFNCGNEVISKLSSCWFFFYCVRCLLVPALIARGEKINSDWLKHLHKPTVIPNDSSLRGWPTFVPSQSSDLSTDRVLEGIVEQEDPPAQGIATSTLFVFVCCSVCMHACVCVFDCLPMRSCASWHS